MTAVADAIARGLAALARMQRDDGSFPLMTGSRRDGWRPSSGLFATAYILLGAGGLLPRERIERALAFIADRRRPDRLWEFDPAIGIPPDSDSTACSLAALALHGGTVESGDADLLRTFWRPGEGPFRTWRVPGDWSIPARDDPVVNCNLVLALDLLGSPAAPAETAAVEALLGRSTSGSRYYCAPAAIAHAARRAGFAPGALPATAAARPTAGGVMAAAQWLAAGLGRDDRLVAGILAAQRPDGSWPGGAWVFGVGTPFWGSAAVTTAFAVEALADLVAATGAPPPWTAARAVAMKRRSRRDAGLAQG